MTCIVGYKDKSGVYIGGDTMGSNNSIGNIRKDVKVFQRQSFLIGFTSSYRMGQLLQWSLDVEKQKSKQSDFEYMCTTFIEAVRKCFREGGYLETDKGVDSGGHFIVGYKNKLYEVQEDYQVSINTEPYCACGSGMFYAYGSLHSQVHLTKETDPKKIIRNAINTAIYFNPFVGGKITIKKLKD